MFTISMEKSDTIAVRLNGKNYLGWSFHLKNFVEGLSKPTE